MATKKTDTKKTSSKKKVDLPPTGDRNTDPLSGAAGAHPIEAGAGAALGGAAAGLAIGALGGPVGAVIGGIIGGGLAGGLGGKALGEAIDPTIENDLVKDYHTTHGLEHTPESAERIRPAYRYGLAAGAQHHDRRFEDIETDLRTGWEKSRGECELDWSQARGAARHAFDRSVQLREEKLRVGKTSEKTGDVKVRKEVHTDHKTIEVPVEREEIVIEHRAAGGRAAGDVKAEEIRIPVREEKAHVSKETVAREEVQVSKRKVHDTEKVSEDVKREELVVETEGKAKVRHDNRGTKA